MKLSIQTLDKKALSKFMPICNGRSPLPILSNLLLSANNDKLTVTASNLNVVIKQDFDATITEPGDTTVPGKKLYDIVDRLTGDDIQFVANDRNLTITQGASKFSLPVMSADDFPEFNAFPGQEISVTSNVLLEVIKKVSYAVSNDNSRFNLDNMLLEGNIAVATDGHRLAKMLTPFNFNTKILLPLVACQAILKSVAPNEDCKITISDKQLGVITGDVTLLCRLQDGDYPTWEKVIPTETGQVVTVKTSDIAQVLKRVSPMAVQTDMGITVLVNNNTLTMKKESAMGSAEDSIEIEGNASFEFIANAKYLADCLGNIDDETTKMSFVKDGAPIIFSPESNDSFINLVMPMRK